MTTAGAGAIAPSSAPSPAAPGTAPSTAEGSAVPGVVAPAPTPGDPGAATPLNYDFAKHIDEMFPLGDEPQLDLTKETLSPAELQKFYKQQELRKGYVGLRDGMSQVLRDGLKYNIGGEDRIFKITPEDVPHLVKAINTIRTQPFLPPQQLLHLAFGDRLVRMAYEAGSKRVAPAIPAKIEVGAGGAPGAEQPTKLPTAADPQLPAEDDGMEGLFAQRFPEEYKKLSERGRSRTRIG